MNAVKKDYSFEDAMRDAIHEREAAGQLAFVTTPEQRATLERLAQMPVPATKEKMHDAIVEAIRTVYDPELPVNLYDLGLIYDIAIHDEGQVDIAMTLTAPGCPVAGEMPLRVEKAAACVNGVNKVRARLVWDPPWTKDMMSEAAQLELGLL